MRLLILLLTLAALAVAQNAPRAAAPAAHKRAAPAAAPQRSDAEIQRAIDSKLARSKMAGKGFTVKVQNGVATIDGKADIIQHKGAMTRMARTAGALQVVNRIQVSEAERAKAREKLASGRRRAQVRRGEVRTQPR